MGLLPYTGQPLLPDLSGLGLEYVVYQVYSRDAGEKVADISFRVEGGTGLKGSRGEVVRTWKFDKGTDGWKAVNNCKLETARGALKVTMTGNDPHFSVPIEATKGQYVLRFWAKFEKAGSGEVFWLGKGRIRPDLQLRRYELQAGRGAEYEVRFNATEDVTGIRIDPGNDPGTATFDWITLSRVDAKNVKSATAKVTFDAQASVKVTFHVTEEGGTPATASFLIR